MRRKLTYLIAARYLRSRKSHSMINVIAGVSVLAMATPVAAMIILLSVFNGLETMVRDLYTAVDPDITLLPVRGATFPVERLDTAALRSAEGVEALSLVLSQGAMAESGDRRAIVDVRGVESDYVRAVPIADHIYAGAFDLAGGGMCGAVAGHGAAHELGLSRRSTDGEPLRLYAINRTRFSALLPIGGYTRREVALRGIYAIDEDSGGSVFVPLETAQELFNYEGRASSVAVKVAAGADAEAVAERLQETAGGEMKALTRERSNSIYRLMALEKRGVFFVVSLVLLVASLSMVGTMAMMIIDKRDDAATLRTLGARGGFVRGVFLREGDLLAALSLVLGLAAGVGITLAQQHLGLVRIETRTLMVDAYPVELHAADVALTAAVYLVAAQAIMRLTVKNMLKHIPAI